MAPAAVVVTVKGTALIDPQRAFDAIVPIDLTLIFRGLGPLPAVVGTREQTGGWDHAGAARIVELADGSEARERLTDHRRPEGFGYRVQPLSGSLARLVRHIDGEWHFSAREGGREGEATAISWSYAFQPRGAVAAAAVRMIVAPLWRIYARRALALAIDHAQRPTPPA